jgi:CBS domain-containing protein
MPTTVRDVMTSNPIVYPATASLAEAARGMREYDIGDVLVDLEGKVGIVTDRDIVVRAVAEGLAPDSVSLGDICSEVLVKLAPSDTLEKAGQLMREYALRRVPVCDDGRAVGIVTLGDLAIERDGQSVLAAISASPPND